MIESIKGIGAGNAQSNAAIKNNQVAFEKIEKKKVEAELNSASDAIKSILSENKVEFNIIQKELADVLESNNLSLEFAVDDETNKTVLKFIDVETEEIIRQFPPEVSLMVAKLVSKYKDQGMIVNAKV